jgi:hypothetical protein
MKALSIRQPWAWLIVHAGKECENRTRRFSHRGPLLIHASATMTRADYEACQIFIGGIADLLPKEKQPGRWWLPAYDILRAQCGGIVGQMNVVDCVEDHPSPWFCGPWALVIDGANELPFYPCKGHLSLFEVKL